MITPTVDNDQEIFARLNHAWAETDELFTIVRHQFLYERPIPERHRIVFYIGHLEAFDWNLLSGPLGLTSFDPEFDRLFAFGIDPVEGNLPTDQPVDWPSLERILDYRDRVREALIRGLDVAAESPALDQLLNVAIEHRLMHAETLAYILHQMAPEKKVGAVITPSTAPAGELVPSTIRIPAGPAILGLARDSKAFGWDNEFDAYTVQVPGFLIDKYKVTNGQFLKFLEAGGYQDKRLWAEEDWDWREDQAILHPAFWLKRGDGWAWRSMFGEIALPLDSPVYVSHAEANAYAKWIGAGLPSEAQWQRAAFGAGNGKDALMPNPVAGVYDPSPVNASGLVRSDSGAEGMIANGWEWTSSTFRPFHGFRPFDCYLGYSEPFFDEKHFVLKGGSVRTAASMLRPSFRNWFQPHYQYVYAGFRCVYVEE